MKKKKTMSHMTATPVAIVAAVILSAAVPAAIGNTIPQLMQEGLTSRLKGHEDFLESLAQDAQRRYRDICRRDSLYTLGGCQALACATRLSSSILTCTNNSDYGNLVGLGCDECRGRSLDFWIASVQKDSSARSEYENYDIAWTAAIMFRMFRNVTAARWMHFTTELTGVTRTYPGVELNQSLCNTYPRLYPRYVSALSGYKDLVIVVQNLASSGEAQRGILLDAVNKTLGTLGGFDRVGVVTFDESGAFILQTGVGDVLQQGIQLNIDIIKRRLGELASGGTGRVEYSEAFRKAYELLNRAVTSPLTGRCASRVIVLITVGSATAEDDKSIMAADDLSNGGSATAILSYSLQEDKTLKGIAERYTGFHTVVSSEASMPAVVSSYYRYLWALRADKKPQPVWSDILMDLPSKSEYVTVSMPVFKQNCPEVPVTISSLIGVMAIDVAASPLLQAVSGRTQRQDLRNTLVSRQSCNSTFADSCSVATAYPEQPASLHVQNVAFTTSSPGTECNSTGEPCSCNIQDLPSLNFAVCALRTKLTCCTVRDSNCTSSSDSSSGGLSLSAIISISIWAVILCAYPCVAGVGKCCKEASCDCDCRRHRSSAQHAASRARPSAASRSTRSTCDSDSDREIEMESYANRELSLAPPPSYRVALRTTEPVDSTPSSMPSCSSSHLGSATIISQPGEIPLQVVSPPEYGDDQLPPPAYDDIAASSDSIQPV